MCYTQMSVVHLATSTSPEPDAGSRVVHTNNIINNKPFSKTTHQNNVQSIQQSLRLGHRNT